MNKILLIIRREYLVRVRKKSFIIMTILTPLIMAGIIILPTYLAIKEKGVKIIALYDEDDKMNSRIKDSQYLHFVKIPNEEFLNLKTDFDSSPYYALLDVSDLSSILIYSKQQISLNIKNEIENNLIEILHNKELEISGIDLEVLDRISNEFKLKTVVLGEKGEIGVNPEISSGIGFLCGILIYIFIFMYGTMVMRGVIEEKTNRIIEIIISSVKPFQLMMGKIIGVALVGLTQFLLWVILSIFIYHFTELIFFETTHDNIQIEKGKLIHISNTFSTILDVDIMRLVITFIFYFLGGYFLYSSLFAAVGSAVDTESDTQQFILPITVPLIISFILIQPVMDNPDGTIAFWASLIPLTSPIIMMVRLPFGVSNIELIISMLLLIIGFITTTYIAAKIYRIGILMYGKKPTYKELLKWISYRN